MEDSQKPAAIPFPVSSARPITTWLSLIKIGLSAWLIFALFLPWLGSFSLLKALQVAFSYSITVAPVIDLVELAAIAFLLLYAPVGLGFSIRARAAGDTRMRRALTGGLIGLVAFPALLAIHANVIVPALIGWGYWLYALGIDVMCILEIAGLDAKSRARQVRAWALPMLIPVVLGGSALFVTPRSGSLALVGGTLIDGSGALPVADAVVVVQNGKITAAGPRANVQIPLFIRQIDVSGAYILPGVVDAHVHNAFLRENLRAWAREGVTSVCDVGSPYGNFFAFDREWLRGDPTLARLATSGPIVTVERGYPIAVNNFPSLTVASPEDAAAKTAFLAGQGVDVIKTALEISAGPSLSPEELTAIVHEADRQGLRVRVHQTASDGLQHAVNAGAHVLDHTPDYITPALMQQMLDQHTVWVPTIEVMRNFGMSPRIGTLKPFIEAGGMIALGTDAGYYSFMHKGMPIADMEWLQQAGLNNMQVIVAATKNSAYACGLEDELGTVETGKYGDLIVVAQDPLADIHALKTLQMVIRDGVVIVSN